MNVNGLVSFIEARHDVYIARFVRSTTSPVPPWTYDPILQKYRFCNVYREFDKVTKWISSNWRTPHKDDPDLWFAMVVARLFNNPETLNNIGYPVPFKPKFILNVCESMKYREFRIFNPAYIVSTNGVSKDKVKYVLEDVLDPLWQCRKRLRPQGMGSLANYATKLLQFRGLGGFMVGQVIADLKYVEPLFGAVDWWTWAISGPGSRRGLNRVVGKPVTSPWKEEDWHKLLLLLREAVNPVLREKGMPLLHAQDLQNCLCEFDKYERVRLGEGTPKQLYKGA